MRRRFSEPSTAWRMSASSSRVPSRPGRMYVAEPRPLTLEATTSLSRPPRPASQEPMIRSVEPCVSAQRRDRVHLGRVDEVDAGADRVVKLGMPLGLGILLAEGHRAEADRGDLEIGAAEAALFHHVVGFQGSMIGTPVSSKPP